MENKAQIIDYESYLSDDCLHDFLKTIKKYKSATRYENEEMFTEYRNGNLEIKDLIIKKNLSLVVSIVFHMHKKLTSEEKLDYIQSGIIGLMEAVDSFDLSRGTAFSTHAEYWIQMRINRYRYTYQRLIRRPENLEVKLSQYNRLVADCEKNNKPLPPREEICSILGITEARLKCIEEDYKLEAISIDAPVSNDDNDSVDLANAVGDGKDMFSDILDKIVVEEILKTLKINLTDYEYYIFYHRILSSQKKIYNELSAELGVSRQAICQTEDRITSKVKTMFNRDKTIRKELVDEVKKKYPFESINLSPCPIENYILYFFLKDKLSQKDHFILRELLIGNLIFNSKRIAEEILESEEYVEKKKRELEDLIAKTTQDIHYKLFRDVLRKTYKNRIYNIDLDADLDENLNIRKIINDYWQDKNDEDAFNVANNYNVAIPNKLREKIKRYFGIAPKEEVKFNPDYLERDINYSLYGFAIHEMPLSKLYQTFLENEKQFTEKQKDYLNTEVFKRSKSIQQKPYLYADNSLIGKLILLHYHISDYKSDNFNREKYLSVRTECLKYIDKMGITLLDLYYQENQMTIKEIAQYLKKDETETENEFRKVKNNAIAIYLNTRQYSFDKEIYKEVLLDEEVPLGTPHYEVCKMFFIEGKSYEEIADEFPTSPKFTPRRVAELVKYACTAMDYYRFGITSTHKKFPIEFIKSVLDEAPYDEERKKIIQCYLETKNTIKTSEICQKDLNKVRYFVQKFNDLVNKKAIEQVEITVNDVEASVLEHNSTNVLNERERIILSLVYGLKNQYNPSGKKKYPIDIATLLNINSNIGSLIKRAQDHVKAHKIGLLKTNIDFIDRKELESILQNPRVPLTEEDKSIIIDAYGLYDSTFLTISDMSKKYGLKEPVIRNRLYKGIVTIKKYLTNEISGNVLFTIDIEPYLKYFTLEDREILTLLYRDKLSQIEIEQKYNLSTHQFAILIQKMRMHLKDLQSGKVVGIDFDYFWSNAGEDDIPFYGNKDLAIELCFLYYEKRLQQSEIIKSYHPELSDSSVSEIIRNFTAAVIKHQNGIRKANDFTYDEVADYYNRHASELGVVSTKRYRNFFAKVKRKGPYAKIRPNRFITHDLIKEKYPDYFRTDTATPDQVREILGKCGHTISKENIQILTSLFGVTHANLLSDEDWEEVINILGPLQLIDEQANQMKNGNEENINPPKSKKLAG